MIYISSTCHIIASNTKVSAMFASLISRTFSANEHYFSLTTNQPTVLSAMAYQASEQSKDHACMYIRLTNKKRFSLFILYFFYYLF